MRGLYFFLSTIIITYIIIICILLPGVPKSDSHPVWRLRRFFISSVEDSVLERSAALLSLCYGIGFGRLGSILLFYYVTCCIIIYVVVLSTRPLNPRDETAYHR